MADQRAPHMGFTRLPTSANNIDNNTVNKDSAKLTHENLSRLVGNALNPMDRAAEGTNLDLVDQDSNVGDNAGNEVNETPPDNPFEGTL
jgi:hypothetical protein